MIYQNTDLGFCVVSVGPVLHKKGVFSVKARPYAALALRLRGSASFRADGKDFTSLAGDITFIPDGVGYEAEYTEGESLVLHLLGCEHRRVENIRRAGAPYIKEYFLDMEETWKRRRVNEVKSLFFRLLSLLEESEARETDAALAACLGYMEAHYTNPSLSLAEIARAGFISEATLRRKCAKHLSQSPKEYVIKLRLSHGISLLYQGLSVCEAAKACGFSDEKFFSRTVKAHYGIPPSAFLG